MIEHPAKGKNIVLGVTGSIAAYKAAILASKLTQAGANVDVILTESACKFITPLTFQSVTGRKAYTEEDLWGGEGHVTHIGLGHAADLLAIVPASANTLAKLANGIGDNLLTVTALAADCPLLIAPAMDAGMYAHPATQENVAILKQRGAHFVGPEAGHLASGLQGLGRMSEPEKVLGHIRLVLAQNGPLSGKKVVITAGGTREPIDPVRFLTNRSSGKQGYALAQAALDSGADVCLITAPTALTPPCGAQVIAVQTAAEMQAVVLQQCEHAHALIMAAAVADFRPSKTAAEKIKKQKSLTALPLEPTLDILQTIAGHKTATGFPKKVIGFAAESQNLIANAKQKLARKQLDMIVANDISAPDAGFAVDTNRVTLIFADGHLEELPLMEKEAVAQIIVSKLYE